jgi:hypothetical protein
VSAQSSNSRWVAQRISAALFVVAALSGGLSACGSNSSPGAKGPTSSVAKEAGGIGTAPVQLTVISQTSQVEMHAKICENYRLVLEDCPSSASAYLDNGKSVQLSGDHLGGSIGQEDYIAINASVPRIYYKVFNPTLGEPYFELAKDIGFRDSETFHLSQGEATAVTVTSDGIESGRSASLYNFELKRASDTDYKVMTLDILDG